MSEKLFLVYSSTHDIRTCMCMRCANIKITYLYAFCNVYILAKRAVAEVLEDRRGNARNELRESTCLK